MIYAHGGLNSEDESIQRIRVLAPYAEANGIYPLFMTWKTGPVETLQDIFKDYFRGRPELGPGPAGGVPDEVREGADRMIEATSHLILRGVWSEMRGNAEFSTLSGRAVDLLAKRIISLRDVLKADNRALEVHLVGHSAGSIVLGWLLDRLIREDLLSTAPRVRSCTLFAAACSLQFAIGTYAKAAQTPRLPTERPVAALPEPMRTKGRTACRMRKRDSTANPCSISSRERLTTCAGCRCSACRRRSSRKLSTRRTGQPSQLATVTLWHQQWSPGAPGPAQRGFPVVTPDVPTTATRKTTQATHGSFDNNVDVIAQTLQRIKGRALIAPIEWLDY